MKDEMTSPDAALLDNSPGTQNPSDARPAIEPIVEHLQDWHTAELKIHTEQRLVTDLALAGTESKNGRRYPQETLQAALPLYAGRPVFLDHAVQPNRPFDRSMRDLVGTVLNPRFTEGRVRADVQVFDTEAGRTFLALLGSQSTAVGMSHVVLAEMAADRQSVQRIQEVVSVDAVVFPATTHGFREQCDPDAGEETQTSSVSTEAQPIDTQREEELQAEIDRLREELHERDVQRLLDDARLPEFALTESFRQELVRSESLADAERRIRDQQRLVERCRQHMPHSRERRSNATDSALTDAAIVKALRRVRG